MSKLQNKTMTIPRAELEQCLSLMRDPRMTNKMAPEAAIAILHNWLDGYFPTEDASLSGVS